MWYAALFLLAWFMGPAFVGLVASYYGVIFVRRFLEAALVHLENKAIA